jgi:glycosyltransferase involved in cell wall biosynthesis
MKAEQKGRVSVIVPAYNAASYIDETLGSLLAQTYSCIEILVVNDGSTDDTKDVVESYGAKVRYIEVPNRGVCAARNIGVAQCFGDYVIFLDADDIFPERHVELMVQPLLDDPTIDVTFCDTLWFKEVDGQKQELGQSDKHYFEQDIQRWLMRSFISMGAAMYRKEALQMVGGFDVSLHNAADIDLHLKLARHTKWKYVPDTTLNYRVLPVSMSKNYHRFYFQSRNVRLKHMLNFEGAGYWRPEINKMRKALRKRAAAEIRSSLARNWRTKTFWQEMTKAASFLFQNPSVLPYVAFKSFGPRSFKHPATEHEEGEA